MFRELNCTKEGLTNEEGQKRLTVFGPNKLEEKSVIMQLIYNQVLLIDMIIT